MVDDGVQIDSQLPAAYGPDLVIRFFPDYAALHPLWLDFDHPDLAELQLPEDLAGRLRRWSAYWDETFHWDDGWPVGAPPAWWTAEQERLPRDVAIAFGSHFVVQVDDLFLHSTAAARSRAAAAALHALIEAEAADRARVRAEFAAGARYDAAGGGSSYREWLSTRRSEPGGE